jgi:16S rRNA (guanine527-N7)-methyltransferase
VIDRATEPTAGSGFGPESGDLERAGRIFGDRLELAVRFARLLATTGIERGLLGPREAGRIWPRHLFNCAVLTELLPPDARVVDVGSGAGLPGLVLAIRRPDLRVDLVESLQRRADFLREVTTNLELESTVRVVQGRAEDAAVRQLVGDSEWVCARAVAPLDRLVGWCLPMLTPGGHLLAVKGERAAAELSEHRTSVYRLGGRLPELVQCGVGVVSPPVAVVRIERG